MASAGRSSEASSHARGRSPPPTYAPPLPPRASGSTAQGNDSGTPNPPPRRTRTNWSTRDPRSRSTDSLGPRSPAGRARRTLLLIFIHGFHGSETSFLAFPAHLHNLAAERLAGTHVVHTKIYPRYPSRKHVDFARDNFSNWLCPHEGDGVDVVLLGHSMGGIIAAEAVLLAPYRADDPRPAVHRILGTVNFDVPFLGINPGIVKAGLASVFRSEDAPPPPADLRRPSAVSAGSEGSALLSVPSGGGSAASGPASPPGRKPLSTPVDDPNFNPRFENDVVRPMRKGWDSTIHFVTKHYGGLTKAARAAVASHVEFGGAMADYRGLRARYRRLRALEDVADDGAAEQRGGGGGWRAPRRVRFVNYYTAATGRAKSRSRSRSPRADSVGAGPVGGADGVDEAELAARLQALDQSDVSLGGSSTEASPRISVETPAGEVTPVHDGAAGPPPDGTSPVDGADDEPDLTPTSPRPVPDDLDGPGEADTPKAADGPEAARHSAEEALDLPPLPPEPEEPPAFDPTPWPDKDVCKLAQDMHTRRMRLYLQEVKDRKKAAEERQKLLAKRAKSRQKEADAALKRDQKAQASAEQAAPATAAPAPPLARTETGASARVAAVAGGDRADGAATLARSNAAVTASTDTAATADAAPADAAAAAPKPPRERKFCLLPPKDAEGHRDPTWVKVLLEGVDEVGAHVSLFVEARPHYVGLVNDVGEQIAEWVERDWRLRRAREEGRGGRGRS